MYRPGIFAGLAAAAGVVLVVGITLTAVVAHQPERAYPPGSPEGTVGRYLKLLQEGQVDRAYAMVWSGVDANQFHQMYDSWSQSSHRVTLVSSGHSGITASVTVDVATFTADPFGASDHTNRYTITLVRVGTVWQITGPEYLY